MQTSLAVLGMLLFTMVLQIILKDFKEFQWESLKGYLRILTFDIYSNTSSPTRGRHENLRDVSLKPSNVDLCSTVGIVDVRGL